jgi:hypothetical protein
MVVDFEEEMKRALDPLAGIGRKDNPQPAGNNPQPAPHQGVIQPGRPVSQPYLGQGIIVW